MSGLYEHGLLSCKVLARFVIALIIDYFSFLIIIPPPLLHYCRLLIATTNSFLAIYFLAISKECASHSSISESPGRRKSQATTKPGSLFICCKLSYILLHYFSLKNIIIYKFKKKDRKNLDLDKDVKRSTDVILFSGFCEDYRKAFLCSWWNFNTKPPKFLGKTSN